MENELSRRFRHLFNFRLPLWASFIFIYITICASNVLAANDDYSTWKYSGRLYLNTTNSGANVSSNIANFPVLIRLTSSNFSFGEAKLDGSDFRVAKSDGTHLPYEIERWDYSSKLAEVWVGVDTVYGNNSTQYIVAYWGKGGAGDSASANNVFTTGEKFQGVWHMSEDPNGDVADAVKDATSNNAHGTPVGTMTTADWVEGAIGKGIDLDGSDDYLSVADQANIRMTSDMTMSAWVNWSDGDVYQYIMEKGSDDDDNYAMYIIESSSRLGWECEDNTSTYKNANETVGAVTTGVLKYTTVVFDDTNDKVYFYVDGVEKGNTASTYALKGTQTSPLRLGSQNYTSNMFKLKGIFDEVRLENTARSADWIKLSYQNQQANDSLVVGDLRHENYDEWAYSKTFFLNTTDAGANVTGNVTAFPVLIRLHSVNFTFSEALSAGADIRFAKSDGTHLKYEIERWDATNSLAEIWVKADTVYGNNQTQFIKMFWGKAGATSYSNPEAVFELDHSFRGVWHLEEDGNTTAGGYVDATAQSNDGTGVSMTSSSDVSAQIGTGQTFDGSADYITVANESNFDITSAITISAWIKVTTFDITWQTIFSKGDQTWRLSRDNNNNGSHMSVDGTSGGNLSGILNVNDGNWHHVVGVYDGSNSYIYIDGSQDATEGSTGSITSNDDAVWIANNSDYAGRTWEGLLDEIRVSTAARSADYVKLSYMNQREGDLLVVEDMSEWTYSRAILLNTETSGGGITTTLTDFPTLIRLHAGNFTFSEAQGSGQDIRFRESDGDALSYEIERWDSTNALAEIWVRIPSVSGNSTTEYFNMYWGNANAKDLSYEEHVFETSNNFRGVWHLNEDGNTTTDGYDDASGNDADATGTSMTSSSDVTGIIGVGQDLDGTADYLYASGVNLPTADLTYSTWVKLDVTSDEEILMGSNTAGENEVGFFVDPNLDWNLDGSKTGASLNPSTGTWYHFAITRSSGSGVLYANGVSVATTTDNDSLTHNSCGLLMGTDSDAGCNGSLGNWMDGIIDEPRVSGVGRSADWIKLSYMNQKAIPQFADAEDYSKWTNSAIIDINTTVSGTNVSGNVADFPFLLRFTSDNFTFTEALDGGTDLRFAGSGGEHLAFEVERWDSTNALGEVWVKLHSVLGNNNTQYITMYWGNTSATARSDEETVFSTSDNFTAVYHLDEDGNTTAEGYKDATNNNFHATGGNMENTDDVTAVVGLGQDFDGVDEYIQSVSNIGITENDARTVTFWVNLDNTNRNGIVELGTNAANDAFGIGIRSTEYLLWGHSGGNDWDLNITPDINVWAYYSIIHDGTTVRWYVNGVEQASGFTHTYSTPDNPVKLAWEDDGATDSYLDGTLDEVRISNTNRSTDFIKLSYENQRTAQVSFSVKDDLNGWTYSRNMFLNTQSSGANVTNNVLAFPVLIRLNDESFDFTQAQGSGQDIRFTKSNGDDQLSYEIERWDSTNALAEIWVLVDTVYGNNSAHYIKMYWGNSTAISRSDGPSVFTTGNSFSGVWHLDEETAGEGTTDVYKDATANQLHGDDHVASTGQDGIVGKGKDFEETTNDYILLPASSNFVTSTTSHFTSEYWIKGADQADNGRIFTIHRGSTAGSCLAAIIEGGSTPDNFDFYAWGNDPNLDVSLVANTWEHHVVTFDGATWYKYKNGVQVDSEAKTTHEDGGSYTAIIGDYDTGASVTDEWDGAIDELRFSLTARSADWARAAYENQKANNSLIGVEDYNSWNHKTNIFVNTTASGANTSANVLDFPYLVRLDSFNFNFSQAQTNGEDIRFSKSDGVHISYEIERWDATNEVAAIWVKLDTVYSANSSQYFTMYWGKATAADYQNPENVFSTADNYVSVYHLGEDGNTTTDGYDDATLNDIDLTGVSMTASSDVEGLIGKAQDFDGSADYLKASAYTATHNPTNYTYSIWVKTDITDGNWHTPLMVRDATAYIGMNFYLSTGNDWEGWHGNAADWNVSDGTAASTGVWVNLVQTYDGTTRKFYQDGVEKDSDALSYSANNDGALYIGSNNTPGSLLWNGILDETRISSTARSADFIKLSYHNQRAQDIASDFQDDLSEWSNSTNIYINTLGTGAGVTGNVTQFPLLVRLTSSELNFAEASSDGSDIRFSKSDGTSLAYEIERWDNVNDLAEVWVKVDTVYGDNATQYIKMYWGRPNSIDRSNSENVFSTSNNIQGVWHLEEDGNTTSGGYVDATSNSYDLTGTSMTTDSDIDAVVGRGQKFDGTADFLSGGDVLDFERTDPFSVSFWGYKIGAGGFTPVGKIDNASVVGWDVRFTSTEKLRINFSNTNNSNDIRVTQSTAFSLSTWYYFTMTYSGSSDASGVTHYVDGSADTDVDDRNTLSATTLTANNFIIGSRDGGNYLDGYLDEVRVHDVALSADWIKLSYETQKSAQTTVCFEENYTQNWSYLQDLTLNTSPGGANVTDDVTDFPVLVRLTSENFTFSQAQGSGQDIRFTKSDGTPLFYEIERWDSTNAAAEIWVRADTVYGTNSTQYLKMYWGNASASSKSNANAVFDINNGYVAVWHMVEDGNTTASGYKDATSNNHHGTGVSMTASSDVSAIVGLGQDFDGTADYIDVVDVASTFTNGVSACAWVYWDNLNNWSRVFDFSESGSANDNILMANNGTSTTLRYGAYNAGSETSTDATSFITADTWIYVCGTLTSAGASVAYKDGDSHTTATGRTVAQNVTRTTNYIGESNWGADSFFDGIIDELRIHNVVLTDDYVKLSYENQKTNQTLVNFSSPPSSFSKATRFLFNTTSSGAAVGGDVADIPILVRIDSSHIDFSITQSDGSDILFTDSSGTMLYHEVVLWDKGNDTALVWVKVPTVDGNSTDDYIDLHYGCGNCSNDFHKSDSVWNGYLGVWHLVGGEASSADKTGNGYTGTYNASQPFVSGVTVPFVPNFNGTSDLITTTAPSTDGTQSMSAWVYPESSDDVTYIESVLDADVSAQFGTGWGLDNSVFKAILDNEFWTTSQSVTLNSWQHIMLTYNATTAILYFNGTPVDTLTYTQGAISNTGYIIGKSNANASYFDGAINDVQVSSSVLTANYIKLSYENQKLGSTFLSAASINGPVPVPGLILWVKSDSGITKNASDQVTQWDDISGSGNHGRQSNANYAPLFVENQLAGKPILRFDGTDDNFLLNSIEPGSDVSIFVVGKKNSVSSGYRTLVTVDDHLFYLRSTASDQWGGWYGANVNSGHDANIFQVMSMVSRDYNDVTLSNNGSAVIVTSGSNLEAHADSRIGSNVGGINQNALGDIAEILIYDRAVSDVERSQIERYLQERYFLTPKVLTTLTATTNNDGNVDLNWTLPVTSSPMADTVGIWAKLNAYPDSSRNGILVGYFKTTDTSYTWTVDYPGTWHFTLLVRDTNDNWSNTATQAQDTAAVFGNAGIKLTFNTTSTGAAVDEDQVNFPMLVRLVAADSGIFNACPNADGTHMRFIDDDGVTFLDYEVERYDNSSDLAEFWVRVPVVDGNSSTDFITMEYRMCDNPDASNSENAFKTADNFLAVWHLDESSGTIYDATSTSADATGSGNLPTQANGLIGKGQDMDGTGDYITSDGSHNINVNYSMTCWMKADEAAQNGIMRFANTYTYFEQQSGGTFRYLHRVPEGGGGGTNIYSSFTGAGDAGWHFYAATFDGTTMRLYVDGSEDSNSPATPGTTFNDTKQIWLGSNGVSGRELDGMMDETRIHSAARSADWIKLSYETQKASASVITQSLIQRIYVDSALGSDNYTCIQAENPSTPKLTMRSAAACDKHDAADTVRILVQPGTYTDSVLTAGNHDVIIQAADLNNPPILNGEMGTSPKRTLKLGNKYHLRNLIIKPRTNNNDGIVNSNNEDNFSIIGCQVINDGSVKHDVGIHIKGSGAIGILIANNIVDGATTTGIEVNSDDDVNVVHNVIMGSVTTGIDIKSTGADDITVTNNIIYNATTGIKEADADNDIGLISNNLFYNVTTQVSGGDVDDSPVTSDPLFVSTTFGDENYMKVSANSPAIDAGTNSQDPNTSFTNTATIDFWGTVRPVGSARDIGVYEGTGVSQTFTGEFDTLTTVEEGSDTVGVHTGKWAIIFRKTEGGGIADLRDKDAWATNLLGSDPLFDVNLSGTIASSVTTTAPKIVRQNRVMAVVRQEQLLTANFNLIVDYTIYPSGHIYLQSKIINISGSAQSNKTLDYQFEISAEDAGFQNAGNQDGYGYLTTSTRDVYVGVTEALNQPSGTTWDGNFTAANNHIVWDTDDIDFGTGDEFEHHFLIYIGDEALGTDKSATIYNDTYYPQKLDAVTGTAFASESWENKLVGQWPMDEGAGSTTRDVSGNTRNGTITTATYTSGKNHTALTFTTSAYVTVSHNVDFDAAYDRTYMAWVKKSGSFSGSESDARILSKGSDLIIARSTSANKVIFTAGGTTLTDPDDAPNDAWFHVAATIDAGRISRLYLNGVLKDVASSQITIVQNSSDLLFGKNGSNTGFAGEIDDVRLYHHAFAAEDVQAIYNEGWAHKTGAYRGRASNNNRFVGIMNQSNDVGRFQPVFHIDNWYGGDVPQYVYVDGVQMSHYTDYVSIEEPHGGGGNTLVLQFNKTFTGTDIDVFIDDNDSSGFLGASAIMPTLHTAVTASDQITVKNLSGATFGNVGSKEWEFIIDLDGSTGTTDGDGGIYSWKSSEISPNLAISSATDLTGSDSVTLDQMKFDNVALSGASWTSPDPNTYTINDSSSTRLKITMGATTINVGTPDVVDARTYTFYPTGRIFVSHSITSISAQPTTPQIWIERLNSITASTDATSSTTPQDSARGGKLSDSNINGSFHGFGVSVLSVKSNGSTVSGQTAVTGNGNVASAFALNFNNTYFETADATITVNYMIDFTQNYTTAASLDSALQDVQQITSLTAVTGSIVTNDAMDFNTDGFAEGEGVWTYSASSGVAEFKLNATQARFHPAFKISSWNSSSLPQIVLVNNAEQVKGYHYNATVDGTNNALIIQFNKVFTGATNHIMISQNASLAVTLSSFSAIGGEGVDTLKWTTESELDNLGFYVLRRIKPKDPTGKKANSEKLPYNSQKNDQMLGNNPDSLKTPILSAADLVKLDTTWKRLNKNLVPGPKGGRSSSTRKYLFIDRAVKYEVTYEYILVSVDVNSLEDFFGPVEAMPTYPSQTKLYGNYPNPFNPMTNIRFDLRAPTKMSLKIYDIRGHLIRTLISPNKALPPGQYRYTWDAKDDFGIEVPSGHYIYMFVTPRYKKARKMTLLK